MTIELDTTIEMKPKRRSGYCSALHMEKDEMGDSVILLVVGKEIFHKKVKRGRTR